MTAAAPAVAVLEPVDPGEAPPRLAMLLGSFEGWLRNRASTLLGADRRTADGLDLDDLVQLGRIAMWQALASYDSATGPVTAWVTLKADFAMLDAVRRTPSASDRTTRQGDETRAKILAFTTTFRRERRRDPLLAETAAGVGLSQAATSKQLARIRAGLGGSTTKSGGPSRLTFLPLPTDDTGAPASPPDSVEQLAHERLLSDRVRQAIAELPPRQREYVTLRFFAGYTSGELTAHFGYDPRSMWSSATHGARTALARALADLDPRQ